MKELQRINGKRDLGKREYRLIVIAERNKIARIKKGRDG